MASEPVTQIEPGGRGTIGGTPVGLIGTIALSLYLIVIGAITVNVLLTVWPDQDPECPSPTASPTGTGGAPDGQTRAPAGGQGGAGPPRGVDAGTVTAAGGADGGANNRRPPLNPERGAAGDHADVAAPAGGKSSSPPDPSKRTCRSTQLFGFPVVLTSELLLVLLVMASGMLGSLVHSMRSLIWYVGNRYLFKSWALQYLLQPIVGALMALLFYVIVRGGLFTWNSGNAVNGFGFAAIAAVIGMFSPQAAIKLKQIAETLFTPPAGGLESLPQGNGKGTSPVEVATLSPKAGPAIGGTEVIIQGRGFEAPVLVKFGDVTAPKVTLEGGTSISAITPPHAPGSVKVTVTVKGTDVVAKDWFQYQ